MATIYSNFKAGLLGAAIGSGDTSITSPGFVNLPTVSSPDIMWITLDADASGGSLPEIIQVTNHPSASDTVTAARGQQGTTARSHPNGEDWVHANTEDDLEDVIRASEGGTERLGVIDGPSGDAVFSNIPGTHRDLLIVGTVAHDDASASGVFRASGVRFNGDSGNTYRWFRDQVDGTGARATPTSGNAFVNNIQLLRVGSLATAPIHIWIPNYAGSAPHRTAMADGSGMNSFTNENTADWIRYNSMGRWASTSVITSVTIVGPGGGDDWDNDVQFTLYGLG